MPDSMPESATLRFFASKESQLGKTRRSLLVGAVIMITFGMIASRGSAVGMAVTLGLAAIIFLPLGLFIGKRLRSDTAAISLTEDKLCSTSFQGKIEAVSWNEVEAVTYKKIQDIPYLQFALKPASGIPNKRSFWTGANPAQPMLRLDALSPADQVRLLDAVSLVLKQAFGDEPRLFNELKEEHEFNERMTALAPRTWATYALVALNVGIWLSMVAAGANVMQAPTETLLRWGGNAASEVQRGEWWRLLSATFLHAGLMHVAMNMLGLYTAGVIVERIYGHRLFLLIYFGAGLLGSALSLHFSAQHAVSVGASGAVFGITGALLVGYLQHRDKLPKASAKQMISGVGFFVAYSLLQGFGKQGIDNAAHLGGLLGGCLLAYILPERFDMEHYRKTFVSRSAIAFAAITAAMIGTAASAPRATIDQAGIIASAEYLKRGFSGFDAVMKELQQEAANVKSGRLTQREADERSRSIFAPKFRTIAEDLMRVRLHPSDPRAELVQTTQRMSAVLIEMSAMDSVFVEGDPDPRPADPQRMTQLQTELAKLSGQFNSQVEKLNKKP